MANFMCPFCYNSYAQKAILYVCPDCGKEAPPVGREPIKCVQSGCGGLATNRVCPSCTNIIPTIALQTPNLRFSMVGISTSGKTNYITVMLEELMNNSRLRLAMGSQTNETKDHHKENRRLMYEERTALPATNRGEAPPQIWYISNLAKQKTGLFSGSTVPKYTFSIYDGAGENYRDMEPTEIRYIKSSEAFIITLDPLILKGVQDYVDPEVVRVNYKAGAEHVNSTEIVQNLVNYLKNIKGIPADKPLKIPVAIVLTKFDTIMAHSSFNNTLVKKASSCIRNGLVSMEEFNQVHGEIENWLLEIKELNFLNELEASFSSRNWRGKVTKHYKFFAVSSFGATPTEEGTVVQKIQPHRVLDPMLWLFKLKNFVD